jgi:hypothetical protein
MRLVATATIASPAAASAYEIGSIVVTPKSWPASSCDAANAPATPTATPTHSRAIVSRTMSHSTSVREAPRVTRMPISSVARRRARRRVEADGGEEQREEGECADESGRQTLGAELGEHLRAQRARSPNDDPAVNTFDRLPHGLGERRGVAPRAHFDLAVERASAPLLEHRHEDEWNHRIARRARGPAPTHVFLRAFA